MDKPVIILLISAMIVVVTVQKKLDPADDQIILYGNRTKVAPILTTSSGRPVDYRDVKITSNSRLIFNEYFLDRISHHVRERRPPRVMNAKGAGAFGYFEVTHDVTDICKAKVFNQIGKRTPIAMRFSSLVIEQGGADLFREPKGFAVKLYTEDGNLDYAGFNIPVHGVKDPVLHPSLINAARKNPATNLLDPNMYWDFATSNPEFLHQLLYVFSDRGIPDGYRHMPGHSIHTYQLVNHCGESFFVRFNSIPDAGVKHMCTEKAKQLSIEQPDYATRDLYDAIARGECVSWTVYMQVMSMDDIKSADFDIFDVTRTIPEDNCKTRQLGKLVLNRNAENYFAEIEQLAFSPANVVPGILGSPDKMFEARLLAYREAHAYRLGANHMKIPVNTPLNKTNTYIRDGVPPVGDNGRDMPNYYPNSFNGPQPNCEENEVELVEIRESPADNFDQIRDLYISFGEDEKMRTVKTIVSTLKPTASFIQKRAVRLFKEIDDDFGNAVQTGLLTTPQSGEGVPITY